MGKITSTLSTLFIGHVANFFMTEGFDFIIYPMVIAYFGLVKGAAIMWVLSFLLCYGTILFYNWSKTDWLGIEMVKETLDVEHSSLFVRLLAKANHYGKWAVLIFLSITTDPFICVIYMRRSSHGYHHMNKRDWTVFWLSFIISNLWWTFAVFTGLSLGKWLFQIIMTLF